METFEVKVKRETEEIVTVTLPVFKKNASSAYKVISKDDCIRVVYGEYVSPSIERTSPSMAFFLQENEDCTEGEFQALFNKTMEHLIDLSVK